MYAASGLMQSFGFTKVKVNPYITSPQFEKIGEVY